MTPILAFTLLLMSSLQAEGLPLTAAAGSEGSIISKRQTSYDYQCSTCPEFNGPVTRSGFAKKDFLYINSDEKVSCSGRVTHVDMCFILDNDSPGSQSISLVVLRQQSSNFIALKSLELHIQPLTVTDDQSESDNTVCQKKIPVNTALMVNKGDLIGFSCREGIRVAFGFLPNQNGLLRSVNVRPVFGLETIAISQLRLDSRNDSELPFLRTVIEGMYSNEPTSSSDNCNGRDGSDGGGGGGGGNIDLELNTNNIYNTTLTSFFVATIVATVIILILILIMCGMGMSMLKMKYQCIYNMCRCCLGKKTKGKGIVRRVLHV